MFVTRPNLGMIQNDVIEAKLFTDYMTATPFGLNMDPAGSPLKISRMVGLLLLTLMST